MIGAIIPLAVIPTSDDMVGGNLITKLRGDGGYGPLTSPIVLISHVGDAAYLTVCVLRHMSGRVLVTRQISHWVTAGIIR